MNVFHFYLTFTEGKSYNEIIFKTKKSNQTKLLVKKKKKPNNPTLKWALGLDRILAQTISQILLAEKGTIPVRSLEFF